MDTIFEFYLDFLEDTLSSIFRQGIYMFRRSNEWFWWNCKEFPFILAEFIVSKYQLLEIRYFYLHHLDDVIVYTTVYLLY